MKKFPEAKADKSRALAGNTVDEPELSNGAPTRRVVVPASGKNTWATYRYANQYYQGKYYNVQKLIAQPLTNDSPLFSRGDKTVYYNMNWKAGTTNFLSSVALSILGASTGRITSAAISVYDALSSVWEGLKPTSDIDPTDVYYKWETQTTAVFSYVRLENQSDEYQYLSHISTKCITQVGYMLSVDSWRQNGTGAWVKYPNIEHDDRTLYHTPSNYNNTTRALWAYNNVTGGPCQDAVYQITISGPESKTVQTISPCCPNFPLQCE